MEIEKVNSSIIKLADGDLSALDELYRLMGGRMYSVAFSIAKNRMWAEEIVQDSFIRIADKSKQFKEDTNGVGWIVRIVQNTSLNKLKREKIRYCINIDDLYDLSTGGVFSDSSAEKNALAGAMKQLDEKERKVITYKYYYCYTVREIALKLKISRSNVQRTAEQAEKKLKELL